MPGVACGLTGFVPGRLPDFQRFTSDSQYLGPASRGVCSRHRVQRPRTKLNCGSCGIRGSPLTIRSARWTVWFCSKCRSSEPPARRARDRAAAVPPDRPESTLRTSVAAQPLGERSRRLQGPPRQRPGPRAIRQGRVGPSRSVGTGRCARLYVPQRISQAGGEGTLARTAGAVDRDQPHRPAPRRARQNSDCQFGEGLNVQRHDRHHTDCATVRASTLLRQGCEPSGSRLADL